MRSLEIEVDIWQGTNNHFEEYMHFFAIKQTFLIFKEKVF